MRRTTRMGPGANATIGYAADERGRGVAYARIGADAGEQLLRVPFRLKRASDLDGREIGYAALTAVVRALREWGVRRVTFAVDDPQLVADLSDQRDLPPAIVLPYVRLRCAFNQLEEVTLERAPENDLSQRARAEVALHVAA
jgi:hypothetical protein